MTYAFNLPALTSDPRPDLPDSALWIQLLCAAYRACNPDDPYGLFGNLRGLRAFGCAITRKDGKARLDHGDIDSAEYTALRTRYLLPYADVLVKLLDTLAK